MANKRHFFGELKLIRPVSFRLPDPEYRNLIKNLNGNRLSDLLRDIVISYNLERRGQKELNQVEQSNSKQ